MAEFRPHEVALAEAGIRLVYVGCGLPAMALDFQQTQTLTATVWVDPTRQTYRHLGFVNSWRVLFDLRTLANGRRAWSKGFRQGATQGDPNQQGGVLVVRAGGRAVYGYASEVPGDMPPTAAVLAEARRAAV